MPLPVRIYSTAPTLLHPYFKRPVESENLAELGGLYPFVKSGNLAQLGGLYLSGGEDLPTPLGIRVELSCILGFLMCEDVDGLWVASWGHTPEGL